VHTILIVDDELAIREMIRFSLTRHNFNCLEAENTSSQTTNQR